MSSYKRLYIPGGCYFFTVVTHQRLPLFSEKENIDLLYESFRYTLKKKPFSINAIVILPDHLHSIWTLQDKVANYSTRWQMIKTHFSRKMNCKVNNIKTYWQPRFWEHLIRDKSDFDNHLDYIHYNPVKHGLVNSPVEWRYSTIHKYIRQGWYEDNWGQQEPANILNLNLD